MKIITDTQQKIFMSQLEKDYSEHSEKPLLVPQNEREYWLYTEIWQRCTDFFNSLGASIPIMKIKPDGFTLEEIEKMK